MWGLINHAAYRFCDAALLLLSGVCLYVRHSDPVARSGVNFDGERWFKLKVSPFV
jgi:hypothetical protein